MKKNLDEIKAVAEKMAQDLIELFGQEIRPMIFESKKDGEYKVCFVRIPSASSSLKWLRLANELGDNFAMRLAKELVIRDEEVALRMEEGKQYTPPIPVCEACFITKDGIEPSGYNDVNLGLLIAVQGIFDVSLDELKKK